MRTSHYFLAAFAAASVATSPLLFAQDGAIPVVKSIEVQYAGPASVSKQRILANMRTAVGRPYSDLAVEEDIRNLYATGNISNVRIFGEPQNDGVRVIVVVQTKAAVQKVEIKGVTQVKVKAIRKKLATKPDELLSEANLEADRQKILEFYTERGYKDTAVDVNVLADEKSNKANVVFTVQESSKTIVSRISFQGNTAFKAKELRKAIRTNTKSIIFFLTKSGRLQNDQLTEDVFALREFYQSKGYLDVQVGEPVIERLNEKGDVEVTFTVVEGSQYHVGTTSVSGTEVLTQDEVVKALRMVPGAVYSPQGVEQDVRNIQDLYGAKGYIDVQIMPETVSGGTNVENVRYVIIEGSQSYVNRVNISGNTRTKDKVVRRELAVAPGDVYNSVRVDASRERLKNLNYFDRVDIFPSDTLIPGKKDLNVVLNEKRTGSLNFGAGFSSIDSVLGFVEVTQGNFDITNWPNFTGGGQRFRTRVQYGAKRRDFIVSLTEPYFLDYQIAVGGELFYHDADFLSVVYNQRNYGFNIFTRKAINQFMSWRLDYRLENVTIYDVDRKASKEIKSQEGDWLQSQVTPSFVFDSRDSVFLTRKGTRAEISAYGAGGFLGGNVQIYGFNLEASHYIHLPWDTILTFNGEVAVVDTWGGGDQVPIFDRLYLGGANNLRGFNFRDVSPRDENDDPIGGNTLARLTAEYTFPVVDRVRGAVFYDTGIVNRGAYEFSTSHIASDVGIGVRLDLPIGPVRIDYGIPIQKGYEKGSGGKFNFNIGYQF